MQLGSASGVSPTSEFRGMKIPLRVLLSSLKTINVAFLHSLTPVVFVYNYKISTNIMSHAAQFYFDTTI